MVPLFAHAAHVFSAHSGANLGWRVDLAGIEFHDFLDGIGHGPDDGRGFSLDDIDDDDTGVDCPVRFGHTKLDPQVYHRDNAATQVDDAAHEVWGSGNFGERGIFQHFLDFGDFNGKHLFGEMKSQELRWNGDIWDAQWNLSLEIAAIRRVYGNQDLPG